MTTREVANRLVSLCREGKNSTAVDELYDENIKSIEATGGDPMPAVIEGLGKVKEKNQWWFDNHEVHGGEVLGPFFGHGGDNFCVNFMFDVTFKPKGERSKLEEVAWYKVENGKIVEERFYYDTPDVA
jgi:hypothetical protein